MAKTIDRGLGLVTVVATGDVVRVSIAKAVLNASGIRFVTKGECLQDLVGMGRIPGGVNMVTGPVQIQVAAEDVVEAGRLLRDLGPA